MEPRKPTDEEKKELLDYLLERGDIDESQVSDDLFDGGIYAAVFDDYSTGGPGYVGKVMVIIWDGGPAQTHTYFWQRRRLPGEENLPHNQIDWHNGRHEPRIEEVQIEVPDAAEAA